MSKYYEKLEPFLEKGMALTTATTLIEWDVETAAPMEAEENTTRVIGILSSEFFSAYNNDEVKKLVYKLQETKEQESLTPKQKGIVRELAKKIEELDKIPPKEYREYNEIKARAFGVWTKAKENNRFEDFAPILEQLISYNKKFAKYRQKRGEHLYDILLEEYEPGFHMEQYDVFFEKLKSELIPFIKKISEKKDTIDKSYNEKSYEIEKQKEFSNYLAAYVGFDFNRGIIAESAHPFTTNLHNRDVRITNHFYKNNLESAIFSIIHETGHALYEMGIDDELTQTLLGEGTSMGVHESQSRFYENIIGRSKEFWIPLYPKLVEQFPEQLKEVSLEQFIKGINKSVPGFIRTEADELTYSIHVLIRYEIEKMIFEEKVSVKELPKIWNQKYKEYLGVEPENDTVGILQDVHWSGGMFGYFPTYALGSAIGAQIYYHMKSIMPFEKYLEEGTLTPIRDYLKDKIHKYGKMKYTNELISDMTGEAFNPDYYIRYLKEKYSKLYELEDVTIEE